MQEKLKTLKNGLENLNPRSKWLKAVKKDAINLIDWLEYNNADLSRIELEGLEKVLLNGARDWSQYSWGGNARIYNIDIAEAYCTPSELKRCNDGLNSPNRHEDWLDVQARALYQAMQLIKNVNNSLQLGIKM